MAKVVKETSKTGTVSYKVDYFNPEGKRRRKYFPLKKDAEAYLGKVLAAKKEGRYHDVFDVKKESLTSFNELATLYVENFWTQRSFQTSKRYLLAKVQEHFGEKRLSQITYLDLETYRNKRKATPANGRQTPGRCQRQPGNGLDRPHAEQGGGVGYAGNFPLQEGQAAHVQGE